MITTQSISTNSQLDSTLQAPDSPRVSTTSANLIGKKEDGYLQGAITEDVLTKSFVNRFELSQEHSNPIKVDHDRWLRIFDTSVVYEKLMEIEFDDKPARRVQKSVLNAAMEHDGCREIPVFDGVKISQKLRELGEEMPNFIPVIDILLAEFGYAITARPQDFRVEPLLLLGEPGLGKTRFVRRLAQILNLPFEMISTAVTQSSGDISGSSSFWSNTKPGRLISFISSSPVACPILLLDEVDKVRNSDHYPVMPTLLDLLEPDSANNFRDESLEIRFNLGHMIILATANSADSIDGPLRSRFRTVQIDSPDFEQRKIIVRSMLKSLIGNRKLKVEAGLIDQIANVEMDLRELRRQLRHVIGLAYMAESPTLLRENLQLQLVSRKRSIGFT